MPVYEYRCPVCKIEYSVERSIHAEASNPLCCNSSMERVYSSFGIQFKGGGFYSTGG